MLCDVGNLTLLTVSSATIPQASSLVLFLPQVLIGLISLLVYDEQNFHTKSSNRFLANLQVHCS